MNRLATALDYALWPVLLLAAASGLGLGMAHGRGPLAFNLAYLGLAIALWFLEKFRPHETAWLESDGQEIPDLAHTLVTKIAVQVAVVTLANFGISAQFGSIARGGLWPAAWPLALQVALGLVVAEFGLYWAHRLAHEWLPLWRFHAVHHSSTRLWFLNTGRFHFVDTVKSMVFATPTLLVAGAPGDVIVWVSGLTAFIGILTHCNVRLRFGWLNFVFNTPGLHRWHHSMDLREGNKNYGENLVLWDQLFGTYFDDARRRPPAEIGIREAMPATFAGQIVAPFCWASYQRKAAQPPAAAPADVTQSSQSCHRPPLKPPSAATSDEL
jgi:sterol desaturase/sphingolipid hydroxylase (fatty acid hydroxylase superfamily)